MAGGVLFFFLPCLPWSRCSHWEYHLHLCCVTGVSWKPAAARQQPPRRRPHGVRRCGRRWRAARRSWRRCGTANGSRRCGHGVASTTTDWGRGKWVFTHTAVGSPLAPVGPGLQSNCPCRNCYNRRLKARLCAKCRIQEISSWVVAWHLLSPCKVCPTWVPF